MSQEPKSPDFNPFPSAGVFVPTEHDDQGRVSRYRIKGEWWNFDDPKGPMFDRYGPHNQTADRAMLTSQNGLFVPVERDEFNYISRYWFDDRWWSANDSAGPLFAWCAQYGALGGPIYATSASMPIYATEKPGERWSPAFKDARLGTSDPAGDDLELQPLAWSERRSGRYVSHIASAMIGAGIALAAVASALQAMGVRLP